MLRLRKGIKTKSLLEELVRWVSVLSVKPNNWSSIPWVPWMESNGSCRLSSDSTWCPSPCMTTQTNH